MVRFHDTPAMRLRRAYLAMHRRFNTHFASRGVTADQFVLLSLLDELGPCSQRELVDHGFSDPNTIGAMLRRLERAPRHFVRRRPHPHDGRALEVELTPAGRKACVRLTRESSVLHGDLFNAIPPEARAGFHDCLLSVAHAMQSARP